MAFGQAVDPVVEQHDVDVEITTQHMDEVIAADRQRVAVAGDHPYHQVRSRRLKSGREGWCTTMDAMHAIGVHVIREAAAATDPADEHNLFARHTELRQHFFHLREDRIVAAAWAPANVLRAGEIGSF